MPNPTTPDPQPMPEPDESFGDLLSQYEKSHSRKTEDGRRQIEGTVIAVSADSVFLDIGFKSEGILPLSVFQNANETVKPGDRLPVSVKGRDPEGYYELSRSRVERPTDWPSLERAFADKSTIM
ncbi:MAG: S1 RNA-binding domain-containing protein, partial [Acidobacteriia bacterium]|nr:S1 RNA-binding domain-containing protein [Terriglobia bacterium]